MTKFLDKVLSFSHNFVKLHKVLSNLTLLCHFHKVCHSLFTNFVKTFDKPLSESDIDVSDLTKFVIAVHIALSKSQSL